MTIKLYQQNSYLQEMEAVVLDRAERDGKPALLLDQTVFYPTSGGQMHDTGRIEGVAVVDVQIDGEDIWHLLEHPLESTRVHGLLDWPRRFDFMQQHTGFHLLAGAFYQRKGIKTLATHLGEKESTIEVDSAEISAEGLEEVETLANQVIWEDRQVKSRFVDQKGADDLHLRKAPQVDVDIRLVEIDQFDLDPCGGTHVSSTGQVGLVKILARERIRGGSRFTFLAGGRAWKLVQRYQRVLDELTELLTTDVDSTVANILKLQEENKTLRKTLQQKNQQLAEHTLDTLCTTAQDAGVITHVFTEGNFEMVRFLAAAAIRKRPGTYLFAGTMGRASLVFSTSDEDRDLRPAFTAAIQLVGGRGGGEAMFVQGSGEKIDKIDEALTIARNLLERANKND